MRGGRPYEPTVACPGAGSVPEFGEPWDPRQPGRLRRIWRCDGRRRLPGNASAELALGASGELDSEGVGALHVITSLATGMTADGDQLWTPNRLNVDVGPYFAATLAASP